VRRGTVVPVTDPVIRAATEADVDRMVEVEVAAGRAFELVGMPEVAADVPDRAALAAQVRAGVVWVVEVDGVVAAYVAAEVLDGNAHVAQVSVDPAYAGRRLGRDLVDHVARWGREAGREATTLTTFTDVAWNAPYYRWLGFEVLPADRVGPELARTMAHEATLPGVDPQRRCAMVRRHP
jgi:ribosomal protein S18 acetylase RimI-like enzyme